MAWTGTDVGSGRKRNGGIGENGSLKTSRPSLDGSVAPSPVLLLPNEFEGKDALSYANILHSRNKFVDALLLYESVVEKDSSNVEALIGMGICLQMQNMMRQAFESFTEAIRLEAQNACALTHCRILYKDEGHLMEAAEVYIYSSGSREARRLIFGNTAYGDLRKYLCGFFDATVGNKKESRCYFEISQTVGVDKPSQILFVTEVYKEVVAAKATGLEVIISVRPGNAPLLENHDFKTIRSFTEI